MLVWFVRASALILHTVFTNLDGQIIDTSLSLSRRAGSIEFNIPRLKSFTLSCTLYDPPPNNVQASDHLINKLRNVLEHYGIDADRDIASSTSDAGSDVKCGLLKKLGAEWDWCVPHEMHCALVEAFGMSKDPSQSKNREARALIQSMKKCIEYIHKSPKAGQEFKNLQEWCDEADAWLDAFDEDEGAEEDGRDRQSKKRARALKLPTEAEQRWSSMVRVMFACLTPCDFACMLDIEYTHSPTY